MLKEIYFLISVKLNFQNVIMKLINMQKMDLMRLHMKIIGDISEKIGISFIENGRNN